MSQYRKHYERAMEILNMLNILMSEIEDDEIETNTYNQTLSSKLSILYYAIEDTEATLSESLYDTVLQIFYKED